MFAKHCHFLVMLPSRVLVTVYHIEDFFSFGNRWKP